MKYYINFIFFFALMILFNAFPAQAQSQPQLFLSDNARDTYHIAAITWLPDYQTSMNGRTENPDKPGGGDLPIGKKTCSTYGFQATYDNTKYVCDTVKPIIGMTCYANCRCKPSVIPGIGEECDITCGSACVKSKCKPAVTFTNPNDRCTQKCTQDQNVCTAKTCDSKCASGTSLTCTGPVSGNDGCGSNCKRCCDQNCPTGTSETNPGGCGGSVQNGCGTKTCYNAYKSCCLGNESGCQCGTHDCSNNCGGTRKCCNTNCPINYSCCNDTLDSRGCGTYSIGFYNTCKQLSGRPDCSPYFRDCENYLKGTIVYDGCDGIRSDQPNYQPTWTNYFSCHY